MQSDGKKVDPSIKPITLWKAYPFPDYHDMQYYFTNFTMQFNFMAPGLQEKLPPTDSRLRPDQNALELGHMDLAGEEKARLEDK